MATHSSILAWRIPWTEEPGGLQSKGSQRVGHNLATKHQQQRRGREKKCQLSPQGRALLGPLSTGLIKMPSKTGHPGTCCFARAPLVPPAGWERSIIAEKSCLELESSGASGRLPRALRSPFHAKALGFLPH